MHHVHPFPLLRMLNSYFTALATCRLDRATTQSYAGSVVSALLALDFDSFDSLLTFPTHLQSRLRLLHGYSAESSFSALPHPPPALLVA